MTRRKLQAPNFLNKHRRQSGPLIFNIQISKHIHSANLYPENNGILIHCRLKKCGHMKCQITLKRENTAVAVN